MSDRLKNISKEYVIKHRKEEIEFFGLISYRGEVKWPTATQNIFEHWDGEVTEKKYDVKAMKNVLRPYDEEDNDPNENYHYVELRGIKGKLGWLYGLATHFAFQTQDYYIVVEKGKLQSFIAEKCKDKEDCDRPSLYKFYRRKDRKDTLVLTKTIDLMFLAEEIIERKKEI